MATRIPINKDSAFGFEDRQDDIWKRMEIDMERRRKDWESEIEKMSTDFFNMKPERTQRKFDPMTDRIGIAESYDDGKSVIEKNEQGQPVFRARFNVKDYKPEEVNVKMDTNKIIVQAKHEENSGGASVSREYSREVNIPKEIDPMALQCTISQEGILTVEAPVPAPDYLKEPPVPAPDYMKEAPGTPTKMSMNQPPLSMNNYSSGTQSPTSLQQHQQQQQQQQQQQRVSTPPFKAQPPQFTSTPLNHGQQFQGPPSGQFQHPAPLASFDQFPTVLDHSGQFEPPPYEGQSSKMPQAYTTRTSNNSLSSQRTGSPVTVTEKKFKIETDIEDFSPEDLTVKTLDKKIVITARKQEKNGNRTSTREMNREFHIPENVDPCTVKAFFTDGGRLILEAPYRQATSGPCSNGGLQSGSPMTGR